MDGAQELSGSYCVVLLWGREDESNLAVAASLQGVGAHGQVRLAGVSQHASERAYKLTRCVDERLNLPPDGFAEVGGAGLGTLLSPPASA